MDQLTIEKFAAVAACACPREANEILAMPKCAADQLIGQGLSILFVRAAAKSYGCKCLFGFGDGHFCNCAKRLQLYKQYGL